MNAKEIQFLRKLNLISPESGAIIRLTGCPLNQKIDSDQLLHWLQGFPVSLEFNSASASQPLGLLLPSLLLSLTEHARLHPGKTRLLYQGEQELRLWLPIDDEQAAKIATELVIHILESVQAGRPPDQKTNRLWKILQSRYWNQTHAHLARAAQQLDIPFYRIERGGQQFLQLGQGCQQRLCHETVTDQTPLFAHAATDKVALHTLLQHRGIPLPKQIPVTSFEQALAAAEHIGWPVVLKPTNAGKGQGVWVGLNTPEALQKAWQANQGSHQRRQLIQQNLKGADHRLLVLNGHVLAVAQRQPAELLSNGEQSLAEQIHALNAEPDRGAGYERLKNQVPTDQRLALLLSEQGFSLKSIPPVGTKIQLSRAANISQGGTAIDCSDHIHPDNRRLAEDIATLIGTDVVGIDLISSDISVSWREGGTWLLEANLSPGLRPHLVANPQGDLCQRIVRQWVGDGPRAGRIPTALITGSIGKTTTSRMLAHLLHQTGQRVALTSTTGIELDGQLITSGDLAGGGHALRLLQDRRVEAMVAEISRGGLLKGGLGIEMADVAAVLNVLDNHVGTDGIRSRNDLAKIKGLVAAAADQLLVLNADDPLVVAMAQGRPASSVALVSEMPCSAAWHQHKQSGHIATSYRTGSDGRIELYQYNQEVLAMPLRKIPSSEESAISSIAATSAFAATLAHGLGLTSENINDGLASFGNQQHHRQGRFEKLIDSPYDIIIAWADGPQAMASLSQYALAATKNRKRRKILLTSAADHRTDSFLYQMGQATWGFDLVICCSREERKGRAAHEVPSLLAKGVKSLGPGGPTALISGPEPSCIQVLKEQLKEDDFCIVCTFHTNSMKEGIMQSIPSKRSSKNGPVKHSEHHQP